MYKGQNLGVGWKSPTNEMLKIQKKLMGEPSFYHHGGSIPFTIMRMCVS